MDNTEGLYLVTFEIESMGYLWQNDSEQVKGMVAGMESAQGGLLQRVIVASKNRVGGNKASSLSRGRAKIDDLGRWQQGFFSVFVVAKGWGLGVARLFILMVVIWLEGGGMGDSRWVYEFGRFCVWFEIWVTVVWCSGVLMGGK